MRGHWLREAESASIVWVNKEVDPLYPKVLMIVGRKADIEASAQFAPKYMTPAAYICPEDESYVSCIATCEIGQMTHPPVLERVNDMLCYGGIINM